MSTIVVVDYDESWPRIFEDLRATVWSAVGDFAISIEHVGSTSVPGLAAKPVIDLDVVVADSDVTLAIERLTALGYRHCGDLGIPQREAFRAPAGSRRHNLYVCPSGSPALANHLAIRDHLRCHDEAASAYGRLKKRLAQSHADDIDAYVEAKTDFLVSILRKLGFSEDMLLDIERMNQKDEGPAGS